MKNKSPKFWLIIILAGAVLLRIAAAIYFGDTVVDLPGTFDQLSYDMLARQVVAGHGFTVAEDWWPLTKAGEPTAHWSYLYTLYLAGVYALVGYHPLMARLLQAVIAGVAMPWLTYRLGRRHFGETVGIVAAALMAGYIYFFYYAATLMTETFYITAILWSFDLTEQLTTDLAAGKRPRAGWVWLGLSLGIAVLLRQLFLLFIPFLAGWLLWRAHISGRKFGAAFFGLVVSGMIVVAMILPWTVRNYQAFNQFVLLNTNAGFAFFWGNHPIHGTNFIAILPPDGLSYQDLVPPELRSLNEAALDSALLKRGLQFIADDPGRYLLLSLSRTKDYFKFLPSSQSSFISNVSRVLSFGIFLPFMLAGVIISFKNGVWQAHTLLYLFILVYTGVHLLSWALIRYRLPVDAALLPFAALSLAAVWRRFFPARS